jgi:hypothetical protein
MSATEISVRLAEAQTALHALMTGKQVVSITDPSGRRVDFTAAKREDLERYIQNLRAQTASDGSVARRGPFEVTW